MSRLRRAVVLLLIGSPMVTGSYQAVAQSEYNSGGYESGDSGFEAWKKERQQGFNSYRDQVQKEMRALANMHQDASDGYESRIADVWAEPEQSSRTRWVLYEDEYKRKRVVDFEKDTIVWSTPERYQDSSFSKSEAGTMLAELMSLTRRQAFAQDEVASEIESRSRAELEHLETAELDNKPILPAYLFGNSDVSQSRINEAIDLMLASATKQQLNQNGQPVITWTFSLATGDGSIEPTVIAKQTMQDALPPKSEIGPAPAPETKPAFVAESARVWQTKSINPSQLELLPARIHPYVYAINRENVEFDLSAELLLAIIETESAFNPMAKSPIPAYGLMQIVPVSAGQDATEKLFGKPRLLAPSYLYNPGKNIQIGAAYFHILYYRYFKGVEDPLSRLYCSIAAYNTGPGNVSKALTGHSMALKPAIRIANSMSSQEVYDHLMSNLPYEETINYMRKVTSRLSKYQEMLASE
jgi:membrane-bound lytic murein transglycosylase C